MTSSYNGTTTATPTTTLTAVSRFWQCPDGWPQTGVWCDYYPDGHTASAPPTRLLDDAFRILKYSLIAFVALRMVTRTSTSALIGLCLVIGGFAYDAFLHLPKAEAAVTAATNSAMAALSTTSAISTSSVGLPMFAEKDGTPYAPFQPPPPGSAPWPNMYPGGPYGAPGSAASRFATPSIWLVCAVVVCFCFAKVAGGRQIASYSQSSAVEVSRGPAEGILASGAATPGLIGSTGERVYQTISGPMAGRLLAERKEIKPTKDLTEQSKSDILTVDQDKTPSATRIALLLAMVLLAGMMIPIGWEASISVASSTRMSKMALFAMLAALVVLVAAESDQPVYLPVETIRAIGSAVGPRAPAFAEPPHVLVGTPSRYESTMGDTLGDISIQNDAGELAARNIDTESSTCEESSILATPAPSKPTLIPAGQHWAVNDSMESGADAGSTRCGWTGLVAGLWAVAAAITIAVAFAM